MNIPDQKIITKSLYILQMIITVPFLFFSIWAITFSAPFLFLIMLAMTFLLFPINNTNITLKRIKVIMIIILLITSVIGYRLPFKEINGKIRSLHKKLMETGSPDQFTIKDKFNIWGLNLAMGTVAVFIYPEAAVETILLILPNKKNSIRIFRSDFPLKSLKVRKELQKIKQAIRSFKKKKIVRFDPVMIAWKTHSYSPFASDEARAALALNATRMQATAIKEETRWRIDISCTVRVAYPPRSYVALIKDPELMIEEGLFWVLQEEGLLFPYTAVWKFTVYEPLMF